MISALIDVHEYLGKLPYINEGGCGISALSIYRWLKNHIQYKESKFNVFLFLYTETNLHTYEHNIASIRSSSTVSSCNHVVLNYDFKYYDTEGEIFTTELDNFSYSHTVNESDLICALNNYECWSQKFNRNHIDEIEQMLKIDLSDIVKKNVV